MVTNKQLENDLQSRGDTPEGKVVPRGEQRSSVPVLESNTKRRSGQSGNTNRKHSPTSSNLKSKGLSVQEREELEAYTMFFTNLFEETQMTNIAQIVSSFEGAEVDRDRLQRDITTTNREIELLEEEISKEKKKMSALKQLSPEEMQRYHDVQTLEGEKRRNQDLLQSYETRLQGYSRSIVAFRVESNSLLGWSSPCIGHLGHRCG